MDDRLVLIDKLKNDIQTDLKDQNKISERSDQGKSSQRQASRFNISSFRMNTPDTFSRSKGFLPCKFLPKQKNDLEFPKIYSSQQFDVKELRNTSIKTNVDDKSDNPHSFT